MSVAHRPFIIPAVHPLPSAHSALPTTLCPLAQPVLRVLSSSATPSLTERHSAFPRSGSLSMRSRHAPAEAAKARLERRRAAGTAAEQALALYRAIFVNSTEAIAIIDPNGEYLEQNAAHEHLVGYSDDELRGRTPAIHLGEDAFRAVAAELAANGGMRREYVSHAKDGRCLTIELSAFAVRDLDGAPVCYVGIKRDITDQRLAAAELQQKFDELQAVYRMTDAVVRADALEDVYAAALDELQRTVHASRASILLYDDDDVMRFKAWRGLSEDYRRAVEGHSPWRRDDRDPQPLLIPDVRDDPSLASLQPVLAREGIRAIGFIPLVYAGRLHGKFMIYFDEPHVVPPAKLRLAQTIAANITVAISRTTERRRNEREQRLLAEAGTLLNSSLDYQETLRSVTRLVVPAIADWCLVDLTNEDEGYTRIAAAAADPADADLAERLRRRYAPMASAEHSVWSTAHTGTSELCTTVTDEVLQSMAGDAEHLEMARAMKLKSYICSPLIVRGRTIGAITFATSRSRRRYTAADVPLCEELARRAALAVENARLYREAHEANRAKSQFLTTMSHELRTPLNAIGGYAELLEMGLRGPITDEQREDIGRIRRSQKHLLGLINDLLNFARIESGHVELHVEEMAVEEELTNVELLIQPQIVSKGLHYRRVTGDATLRCLADRDKLRQVLLNLVSNAVKFTPADGEVALDAQSADGMVQIHVSDTGPGIPTRKLEAIFEPFVQLTSPLTRTSEGTGLGLAISRELARAMGGDVTVASRVGQGSTFTVSVPIAPVTA